MKKVSFSAWTLGVLALTVASTAFASVPPFTSSKGREYVVTFQGVYRTDSTNLADFSSPTEDLKDEYQYRVLPVMDYLFGPTTRREIGGTKRMDTVTIDWSKTAIGPTGFVELTYNYEGRWILDKDFAAAGSFQLPVPYNKETVLTANWKSCTDSAPDHQTESFYWYFWDPERFGCDHVEGQQYFTTTFLVGAETPNETNTRPEYENLIRTNADGSKELAITFGFGYVEDPAVFNPDTDSDYGVSQYRYFLSQFRNKYGSKFKETKILQGEYLTASTPSLAIGRRFVGKIEGVTVKVNVVTPGGIDQMELFAKSFAHDHDGLFAWFGHSRVGSGFDAMNFGWMVQGNPSYYSISDKYQVIYWAGCNSYSYYTMPFFKFKEDPAIDPKGTKRLDIIANGLPSLFSLNSENAMIAADTFINFKKNTSYQSLVKTIEDRAASQGTKVLNVVIGDEDNNL